jgi:hypothetical protein
MKASNFGFVRVLSAGCGVEKLCELAACKLTSWLQRITFSFSKMLRSTHTLPFQSPLSKQNNSNEIMPFLAGFNFLNTHIIVTAYLQYLISWFGFLYWFIDLCVISMVVLLCSFCDVLFSNQRSAVDLLHTMWWRMSNICGSFDGGYYSGIWGSPQKTQMVCFFHLPSADWPVSAICVVDCWLWWHLVWDFSFWFSSFNFRRM